MTAMLPVHLTETINNLGEAAKELAEEVRADRAATEAKIAAEAVARRRDARRLTALLAAIGVLVFLVAALSIYSRISSNQSRSLIRTIESCTNTDGECAKQSRQATEMAIAKLVAMTVEIEACGRDPQTSDAQYRACVNAALARLTVEPPPYTPPVKPVPTGPVTLPPPHTVPAAPPAT
jgi:hypothetical protein